MSLPYFQSFVQQPSNKTVLRWILVWVVSWLGKADHTSLAISQQLPPLTSIEQIHRVSPDELVHRPTVDLECIVTCYEPHWAILFIHDGKAGAYAGNPAGLGIKRGDRIRIRGTLGPDRFPVDCTYESSENNIEWPIPKMVDFDWLQAGNEDSQFVEIEGQFVGIDSDNFHSCLELRTANNGRFRGLLHDSKISLQTLRRMLGKKLRLTGVVGARFDELGRWSGFQIWLNDANGIMELESPGSSIEMPVMPIAKLNAETIAETNTCYFRTAGIVTYQLSPNMVFLQDNDHRLFVELQNPGEIELDKAYEITGTLDTGVDPPILRMAEAASITQEFSISKSAPTRSLNELMAGEYCGQWVSTKGTFAGSFDLKGQKGFHLKANGNFLHVFVENSSFENLDLGTPIDVTGIWVQQKSLVGFNIGSCALHARTTGVRIGSQLPWLLLSLLGIAGVVASSSSIWAITLRRQVRRKTQQVLDSLALQRRTEEQYAAVFINAQVMVMTTTSCGDITAVNPAAVRATCRSEQELIGLSVLELVDQETRQKLQEILIAANASSTTQTCSICMRTGDLPAAPREVSCWSTHVDGNVELHLIWHDISERLRVEQNRKEVEQRLQSMQKMDSLGVLAGGIAHDFNNLLTVIECNAALLSDSRGLQSDERNSVLSIHQAASRAAELTEQMLAYAGRGKFDIRVLDISEIVASLSQLLNASVSKNTELLFTLSKNLPGVNADATQVKQVLMNLVRNAAESMADDTGRIQIKTTLEHHLPHSGPNSYVVSFQDSQASDQPQSFVCLEVSDQGKGIEVANLKSIFDPFFSTKFSGRGLGLAMVVGIVRGHKGCIEVHSQWGCGATFRVYMPACSAPPIPLSNSTTTTPRVQMHAQVLVVDDEPLVLRVIAKALESSGIRVTACSSGSEALRRIQESSIQFDCIISDQTMPEMSGVELCRELQRTRARDVPVILLSGYSINNAGLDSTLPGFQAFLQKPFQINELLSVVRTTLADRQTEQDSNSTATARS